MILLSFDFFRSLSTDGIWIDRLFVTTVYKSKNEIVWMSSDG